MKQMCVSQAAVQSKKGPTRKAVGNVQAKISLQKRPVSPRNGFTLVFLLYSFLDWPQCKWFSECSDWDPWSMMLLVIKVCQAHSLVAQMVKRLSTMRETWVRSLGWEDSLEKEMATHSSTLAQKTPWMEQPGAGYCPWGRKESDTTERLYFRLILMDTTIYFTVVVMCLISKYIQHGL